MGWHKVAGPQELAEGAVKATTVGGVVLAITHFEGRYGALAGRCPHAGGPLGEGEIELGLLVCPWHGREFHPLTGECRGHADRVETFPVEVRGDGIYVQL